MPLPRGLQPQLEPLIARSRRAERWDLVFPVTARGGTSEPPWWATPQPASCRGRAPQEPNRMRDVICVISAIAGKAATDFGGKIGRDVSFTLASQTTVVLGKLISISCVPVLTNTCLYFNSNL